MIQLQLQHQSENNKTNHHIIHEVKVFIDIHYADNLTLFSIAEKFYISPNYLNELFRKKTKITFLHYLTTVRMEKAKQLLLSTYSKVYEICNQVGYEDPKYFRKIFEKTVGLNPSGFKKLNT